MSNSGIYLLTSNKNKISEYNRISKGLIKAKEGIDIREVLADPLTVILQKSKNIDDGCAVEDTILTIDGKEVVDIKFLMGDMEKIPLGSEVDACWQVMIAYKSKGSIKVYVGSVSGKIKGCSSVPSDAFGFDPYFYPNGSDKSLYELEKEGQKDYFSARVDAVNKVLEANFSAFVRADLIGDWVGEYQGEV